MVTPYFSMISKWRCSFGEVGVPSYTTWVAPLESGP
ncbi:Uncharacterised protein [Mycobacteroides abscessus subsp. abscessus]|nr:Uncharacterised protein [Mycobacteroides abscessus subsp. abscessus]